MMDIRQTLVTVGLFVFDDMFGVLQYSCCFVLFTNDDMLVYTCDIGADMLNNFRYHWELYLFHICIDSYVLFVLVLYEYMCNL